MCDPISLAGVALSGAGMGANLIASNQVQSETNAAEQQTSYLNNIQQQRTNVANAAADQKYKGFAAGTAALGKSLGDTLAARSAAPSSLPSAMAPTGAATQQEQAAAAAPLVAYGDQQAHALGTVGSFGDYLANTNRAAGRNLQVVDQADNFMKGNSAVEGLELNQAQHAGDTASLIGSVASGLGGLGIKAGLTGFGMTTPDQYGTRYGTSLGSLFGGDPTKTEVTQAGIGAGLTGAWVKNADGTSSWDVS